MMKCVLGSLVLAMIGLPACAEGESSIELNECCDYFSYGFCADLPIGASVDRRDAGTDFVTHRIFRLNGRSDDFPVVVYEGNAPSFGEDVPGISHRVDEGLSAAAPGDIVGYSIDALDADGHTHERLTMATHLEWPAYVQVSYAWQSQAERRALHDLVSNISVDRSDELVWSPTCEARQNEFSEARERSWFEGE